jgi:hypothetical protein
VAVAEGLADGRIDESKRADTERFVQSLIPDDVRWSAYSLVAWALHSPKSRSYPLHSVLLFAIPAVIEAGLASHGEVISAIRDIFGPLPFRPVALAPAWLAWNGGTVVKLAEAIYEDRAFDRLPILADALLDAGCEDADLLGHLRGPGPHVRGCWAVDLLLGKG